jgi:hypothetical protein
LDTWRSNGEISDIDLNFDMTNAIAIVGLFARPNPLVAEACADNAVVISSSGARIKICNGITEIISAGDISVTASGAVSISGTTVNIN